MTEDIKILCNSDNEPLINLLINDCKQFAVEYCNLKEYTEALNPVVKMMVCERFNKLGSDGINSKNYSGISESYSNDFSTAIYKGLNKHRVIKML